MQLSYCKFAVMALLLALPGIASAADAETVQERRMRVAVLQRQFDEAQDRLRMLADRLEQLQNNVRKETGLVEVAPDVLRRLIATLQEQREQLELDGAGAQGRREALEEAVAKLSKKLEERIASDEVAKELAKVVEIRQAQLQRMMQVRATGGIPQDEVDVVAANVATARAELAAARQKAVSNASGDALDGWNRQLVELGIAARERQARLTFVSQRLAKISAVVGNVDQLDELRAGVLHTQDLADKLDEELRAAKARADLAGTDVERRGNFKPPLPAPP